MDILYLDFFRENNTGDGNMYHNLSEHCNRCDCEIELYRLDIYKFFEPKDNSLTFPNVVYIDKLYLVSVYSTQYMYPDLREVRLLSTRALDEIDYLWAIDTIGFFVGLDLLIYPHKRSHFNPKIKCDPLGDNMYRFRSKKGSWDIKVNGYN